MEVQTPTVETRTLDRYIDGVVICSDENEYQKYFCIDKGFTMKYTIILFLGVTLTASAQLPQYNSTMKPGDYQLLFTRDIFSDSLIPASFEFQGSFWNDAQIRFKGHSTRYYPKKSYRVKFAKSNLFQNMQSINFNAMYTDKSFIREKLAWDIFAEMNQLAPRAHHSRFTINGQEGLYLFVEKVDKYFLQNRGREVAPMYEANDTYISANLIIQPDSILKMYYDKEIGNANDYSDLAGMINAINTAPDVSFADTVRKYFDIGSVINWFTGNILTMMGDSYEKNYLLYRDTSRVAQQWVIIPWDYDLSFGRSGDMAVPYPASLLNDGFAYTFEPLAGPSNVLKDRFMATPSLWEELRLHVDSSINTIFTEEHLYPRIDSLAALIENYVSLDQQKWGTIQDFYDHIDALKYYVTARRNYLKKTFINLPRGEYNLVTLPIDELGVPYHFVGYDGRQIGTLWFTSNQGLDSIRVRVYPDSTPPGVLKSTEEKYVKRWVEITPFPSSAEFTAKFQWMYQDVASLDREVGAGVQDERLLRCYLNDHGIWTRLPSNVNAFGNFVTVVSITQDQCGAGKLFALLLPETYTQKWFRQPLNYWQRWHEVKFIDSLTGFIAGDHGTILRTTDGGSTWTDSYAGMALPLTAIGIASINNIFVGGENGFMFRSNDTGKSWSQVMLTQIRNIRGINFESAQIGWLFGDNSLLMQTTDGGSTWLSSTIDSLKNIIGIVRKGQNLLTVYFDDGNYAYSNDEGQTWIMGSDGFSKKITRVKSDGISTWIVGENGTVICVPMYGEIIDCSVGASVTLRGMVILNGGKIYVAGDAGKVYYSTNSGVDWYSQYTCDSHDLYALAFTDSSHGYAVGNGGTILATKSTGTVTQVKDNFLACPNEFRLYQNYPNPFNPSTTITYDLPKTSNVKLKVFNLLGQNIATLVNEVQDAGYKKIVWSASNLSNGVYFYTITAGAEGGELFHDVQKLILMK